MELVPSTAISPNGSVFFRDIKYDGQHVLFRWIKESAGHAEGVWYVPVDKTEPWKNDSKRTKTVSRHLILARVLVRLDTPPDVWHRQRIDAIKAVPGVICPASLDSEAAAF